MTFLPSSSTHHPNSPLPVVLWLKGRALHTWTMGETQSLQLALLVFTITWIYHLELQTNGVSDRSR